MDGDLRPNHDQPLNPPDDALAAGDVAAEYGWWPEAVAAWQRALATPSRSAAIDRLRWFVAWRSGQRPDRSRPTDDSRGALSPLLVAMACGILGTAAVLFAEDVIGTGRTLLVAAAWSFYAASAVLSLVFAARTGRHRHAASTKLDEGETARLCAEAAGLARYDAAPASIVGSHQHLGQEGSGP